MDFEEASKTTENKKQNCQLHFSNVVLFDYCNFIELFEAWHLKKDGAVFLVVTVEK